VFRIACPDDKPLEITVGQAIRILGNQLFYSSGLLCPGCAVIPEGQVSHYHSHVLSVRNFLKCPTVDRFWPAASSKTGIKMKTKERRLLTSGNFWKLRKVNLGSDFISETLRSHVGVILVCLLPYGLFTWTKFSGRSSPKCWWKAQLIESFIG